MIILVESHFPTFLSCVENSIPSRHGVNACDLVHLKNDFPRMQNKVLYLRRSEKIKFKSDMVQQVIKCSYVI